MPALATCDAFAPGLAIGHAIGRVGCFAAGCCFGKPTDHFWGVTFTSPIAHELVGTPIGEALQPTQLFESAIELANFFLLAWLLKRKKFDGEVIGTYFFLYGIARFFLEYLRGDPGRGDVFGIITGTQLVALCLIVVGGFIWWLRPAMKPVPAHAQ
jgi:phosphatidylglycerol:prolipoprotein diacylglycerol transferase